MVMDDEQKVVDGDAHGDRAERKKFVMPRKRGLIGKRFVLADNFEDAMKVLTPPEAQFVRCVLSGKNQEESYAIAYPRSKSQKQHHVKSCNLAKRDAVAHALRLGRETGALQAITGLKYDIQAAHAELCQRIEAAHRADQHSALAQLLKLKMTLWKLDQP